MFNVHAYHDKEHTDPIKKNVSVIKTLYRSTITMYKDICISTPGSVFSILIYYFIICCGFVWISKFFIKKKNFTDGFALDMWPSVFFYKNLWLNNESDSWFFFIIWNCKVNHHSFIYLVHFQKNFIFQKFIILQSTYLYLKLHMAE